MPVLDTIKQKLQSAFDTTDVEVIDESHQHAGHAGARPGGETHYAVKITSKAFAGLSRVQCHKLVYNALAEELENGVHALKIETIVPK